MEAGILQQLGADDRGEILMVGNVFGKNDKRDGNVCEEKHFEICDIDLRNAGKSLDEGEFGDPFHIAECGPVDHFERVDAGLHADKRKAGGDDISRKNTDDERNEFSHLLAVNGADHDGK